MAKGKINYEESIKKLEEIVQILEKGKIPIDEAMKLYNDGSETVAKCRKYIEDARLQIEYVKNEGDN